MARALRFACVAILLGLGCERAAPATEVPASSASEASAPPAQAPARPTTAAPTAAEAGRPPHPAIPQPLEEPHPSADVAASTSYRWLSGHWVWADKQYEWQPGVWVHPVPGHVIVPASWVWAQGLWMFVDAGWAAAGESRARYRPTAVRKRSSAATAPEPLASDAEVDVFVTPSSHSTYVWGGEWVAPPILYPRGQAGGNSDDAERYPVVLRQGGETADGMGNVSNVGEVLPLRAPAREGGPDSTAASTAQPEVVPGVMYGGKRGEEQLRQAQEAQAQEAKQADAVVEDYTVPYYYDYGYYLPWRYRPRPPGSKPPGLRPSPRPVRPRHTAPVP
jgi:hypothetical protein